MRRLIVIGALLGLATEASAQKVQLAPKPTYSLGIYVPAAPFASSDQIRAHAEALARAIESANGSIMVRVQVHFRYTDLIRAKPNLAVLDARCALRAKGTVLATAVVGKSTTERWGLYAASNTSVPTLKGDKILHVPSGCGDDAFLAHGLLASELPLSFFGPRIGRRTGALGAKAVSAGIAKAAFLPASAAKGLTRIYDAGPVSNPVLLALGPLPKQVRVAVVKGASGFRGTGLVAYRPGGAALRGLAARLKPRKKRFVPATPKPFRMGTVDTIRVPWKKEPALPILHLVK